MWSPAVPTHHAAHGRPVTLLEVGPPDTGEVIYKGTLRENHNGAGIASAFTALGWVGRRGSSRIFFPFFKEKGILGQAHLKNIFFFFFGILLEFPEANACAKAGSQAELSTCVCGSWELGEWGWEEGVLKCPCPSGDVWAAENIAIEIES